MKKWFKQNITIAVLVTLLAGYGAGAAIAAVMKSDIERLKRQMEGLPENLGRIEERIVYLQKQNDRIEYKLDKK